MNPLLKRLLNDVALKAIEALVDYIDHKTNKTTAITVTMNNNPKIATLNDVVKLNSYQQSRKFHPYTCGGDRANNAHRDYAKRNGGDWGELIATMQGWVCPTCGYTQECRGHGMPYDPDPCWPPIMKGVRPTMTQYAIYERPSDYPAHYVVRQWHIYEGIETPVPGEFRIASTLDVARKLIPQGHDRISRFHEDDPKIVECWV